MRFEQKDLSDAYNFGQKIGHTAGKFAAYGVQKAFNMLGGMFNVPKMDGAFDIQKLGNIGKVNEVGKIRDTVDISSEDLKTMRELAEMKSIQNFVTLTPTVNLTHTGNIMNGYDIETIKERITASLMEDLASSTKQVFNV